MNEISRERAPFRLVDANAHGHREEWTIVIPAVVLFLAVLLPVEMRLSIAEQNLYPTRVIGFLLLPWIVWKITQKAIAWTFWDALFCLGAFWMLLAFMVFYGPSVGFVRGGILVFDVVVPFLIGRLCFRRADHIRRFLIFVSLPLFVAGLSLLVEVMLSRPIVAPLAASVFGELPAYVGGEAVGVREAFIDRRLGILRATGPFSHPILAGLLLSSFLPIFLMSGLRAWPFIVGLTASFFALLSASSAAFLGILAGLALVGTDLLQRAFSFITWKAILSVVFAVLTVGNFATDKGIIVALSRYTLNPQTAAFRRAIWDYGVLSVQKNPWFGIGFSDYERAVWMVTPSVDNHWLLLAMRFGVIPPLLFLAVSAGALWLLCVKSLKVSETDRKLFVGVAISLFLVVLLGFSVAFFGGASYWFYMLPGIALSLACSSNMEVSRVRLRLQQPSVDRNVNNAVLGQRRG